MRIQVEESFKDGSLLDVKGNPINCKPGDVVEVSYVTYVRMLESGAQDLVILA